MLCRKITPTNIYRNLVQNDLFQGDESLFWALLTGQLGVFQLSLMIQNYIKA